LIGEWLHWLGLPRPVATRFQQELLAGAFQHLMARPNNPKEELPEAWQGAIKGCHSQLPADSPAVAAMLAWVASLGTDASRKLWLELLLAKPPANDQHAAMALSPWFQQQRTRGADLFPGLFAGLSHPTLAAGILDLANYLHRTGVASPHPAQDRKMDLLGLLGGMVQSLEQLERNPDEGLSAAELGELVARSVALTVSLCDALGLLGDAAAIPRLREALDLPHRRIRTEAAAALARLGDERGKEELPQLAEEPVARLRVREYCRELGLLERIDPEHLTPAAIAEAELTVWLAEPTQFGIPPTVCELLDERQQRWPGYEQPQNCFLFRYTYRLVVDDVQQRSFTGIGIAGPLVFSFTADLADLPPDDIYAAYAGYQAEHEEIFDVDVEHLSRSEKLEAARLEHRLHDAGFGAIQPAFMGYFFDAKALTAFCTKEGLPGTAVVDFEEAHFYPARSERRAIGPREAYCIYKGRKLLRAFNAGEQEV
jgi:hypothetical protein